LSWILIRFELGDLAGILFPRLLETYSTAEDRAGFRFALTQRTAVDPDVVAVADQFQFRPDCLGPDDVAGTHLTLEGPPGPTHGLGSQEAGFRSPFVTSLSEPPLSLLRATGRCRSAPVSGGLLQVSVRRPGGSSGSVFAGFRRRNLLVSGLVLVVLLAALAALILSTERARRLARLQTVVAAGISHELRSPLASLNVAADHLRNGHVENAEQARRYGDIIEAQSRRLHHVVDQALALGASSRSNGVTDRRSTSVSEIIGTARDSLALSLQEAGIEIDFQAGAELPPVCIDADLLHRCLANLIENSIKYARSGGWIRLSGRTAKEAGRRVVEVTVEDRGPGIPDDDIAAVCEPFYRGSSARQSREPGSGLGLAIVKNAVEAHGGWMQIERAVPQGCKVRLFFPAADQ
jgi:signal transduction histidine kinase